MQAERLQVLRAIVAALGQAGVLRGFEGFAAGLDVKGLDLAIGIAQLLPDGFGVTQALDRKSVV